MTANKAPKPAEPEWLTSDEQQTWIALHLVLATLPGALGEQLRRDSDLGFIDYYVLAVLSEQPAHRMRMSDLAIIAGSELSRLSHVLKRLEKRGLVSREPDPTDGRCTHAIITAEGQELVVKAAPGHVEHVRHLVFDALDQSEQHALRGALKKIVSEVLDKETLHKILP